MINNIFNDDAMKKLKGNLGIGHTRYSTSAASEEVNCQPFVVHTQHGALAVAHNGELVNCESLRRMVITGPGQFNVLKHPQTIINNILGIRSWYWSINAFRQ